MSRRNPRRGYAKASRPRKVAGVKNRTEQEFEDLFLRPRQARGEVAEWWYERITLKLANDCRYTIDFFVLLTNGELEAYEVKGGHIRDDAAVKLKMAAEQYPFRFFLAQKHSKKHPRPGWTVSPVASETWADAA